MNLDELINNTISEHSNKYLFEKSYFLHLTKHYSLNEAKEMYEQYYCRPELARLWYSQKVYIRMLENAQK